MASWPASLPQMPLYEGLSETAPNVILRSQVDAGPAKVRRRYTAGVRPFKMKHLLTKAQVATLDTFFITTCAGGALSFDWTHPRTGAATTYRFVNPPVYTAAADDCWEASFELEVMP